MSAIFGIINFDGAPVLTRALERMSAPLAHRIGDRTKYWTDGPVGLGHGLLRVNTEDAFDAQPIIDRDSGAVLVADLRLDNRDELATKFGIGAMDLRGLSDSALLMRAYQKWGEDCVDHLLGEFVFAIWNGRKRRLFLARDHMGQRSCFFHRASSSFVFSSEIRSLWTHPDVPRALTETGIARLLMHDMSRHSGMTLYEGIEGVTGATALAIDADGKTTRRSYWQPHADPMHLGQDENYYVEAYRSVLGEAVRCRIARTTAPVGLLMSGGYDSSAVAALAGPILSAQGRKLVAVSSVMPESYRGSITHARKWVEQCRRDMPHLDVRYVTREGKSILTGLERSFFHGESGSYHFVVYELYETLAKAGVRVVLDGYGGDQTINPLGQKILAWLLATGRLGRFLHEYRCHMRMTGHSFLRTLKNNVLAELLPAAAMRAWRRVKHGASPPWQDQPVAAEFAQRMIANGSIRQDALRTAKQQTLDIHGLMQNALSRKLSGAGATSVAAAYGLESSHPFFDKRVVELALAIPLDLHVKNGRTRYLACKALADLYPPEFQTRWRKNDDQIPDFQRMVKSIEPEILADLARIEQSETLSGYVDFDKIRELLASRGPDDHNSGWEEETQVAANAYVTTRYIEWFRGHNR